MFQGRQSRGPGALRRRPRASATLVLLASLAWLSPSATAQDTHVDQASNRSPAALDRSPRDTARAIVSRIINDTSFELRTVARAPTLGIQVVDFGAVFGRASHGVAYAWSVVRSESNAVVPFGIARDLPVEISVNGAVAYVGRGRVTSEFKEIGYELFRWNHTLRLPLRAGDNTVLVRGVLSGGRGTVLLRELTAPGVKPGTFRGPGPGTPVDPWLYLGLLPGAKLGRFAVPSGEEIRGGRTIGGRSYQWRPAKERVVSELVIKPGAAYRRESLAEWSYPVGTVMLSLLDYAEAANDPVTAAFVRAWGDFTVDNYPLWRRQYQDEHDFRGTNHRMIRWGMLDDVGAPAIPLAELLLRTGDGRYRPVVESAARYLATGQVRLADGTFCRYEKRPGTVWADDLFMSVPLLVRVARLTGDSRPLDDAVRQARNFNRYLLDSRTGLYHHGWYDPERRQSAVLWGRANGWVVWAMSELLAALPDSHPSRRELASVFRGHLAAIVRHQAPSGRWHQILDRPDSFEETSCTALFMVGIARALRSGVVDRSFETPLRNAWSGLLTRVSDGGVVKDICRGTEMSEDAGFYLGRERFDNDPRGLGAVVTACVEMIRFEDRGRSADGGREER